MKTITAFPPPCMRASEPDLRRAALARAAELSLGGVRQQCPRQPGPARLADERPFPARRHLRRPLCFCGRIPTSPASVISRRRWWCTIASSDNFASEPVGMNPLLARIVLRRIANVSRRRPHGTRSACRRRAAGPGPGADSLRRAHPEIQGGRGSSPYLWWDSSPAGITRSK